MTGKALVSLLTLLTSPAAAAFDPLQSAALFGAGTVCGGAGALFAVKRGKPLRHLADIRARPGASKHGVGLICVQDVPAGGRICGCEPVLSRTVPIAALRFLPTEVRSTVHELYDGVDEPPGTCCVPVDYEQAIPLISFINHSTRPTCEFSATAHAIVAKRPLAIGDECTVNYFEYQEPVSYTYRHAAAGFSPEFARLFALDMDSTG